MIDSPRIEKRSARPYAAVAVELRLDELSDVLGQLWPEVAGYVIQNGGEMSGAPFIRYVTIDMGGSCSLEIGVPTTSPVPPSERIVSGMLAPGRYAVAICTGAFDRLLEANAELQGWAENKGLTFAIDNGNWQGRFESYLTDPQQSPDPATWQTELAYRLADD